MVQLFVYRQFKSMFVYIHLSLHLPVFNSVYKTEAMNVLIWSGDFAALLSGKFCYKHYHALSGL